MANKVIGDYTAAITIDGSTHYLLIQPGNASTAYNKINRNVFLGVTGQPVDISTVQTLSNKVIGNTNTVTVADNLFTIQDNSDNTKQAQFQLSGITTATTRTYTLPNASVTLVGDTSTQTLTNKTLTAPTINNGSITGTTITNDAIVGQTVSNNGTVYGLTITGGKITSAGAANGFCVQEVSTLSSAANTGTTVFPADDTIPQNTEGDQYMTLAITPLSATNVLVIEANIMVSSSVANYLSAGLFQDSTANALNACMQYQSFATGPVMLRIVHTMTAGTTSSTTFKIRAGGTSAGTTTFNGQAATRFFGTTPKSSIVIREYRA